MPTIDLFLDGDGCWPDLRDRSDVIHLQAPLGIAALPGGMTSGRTSVTLRLDLPDGRTVLAETSLRLLYNAARAMLARYPDDGSD